MSHVAYSGSIHSPIAFIPGRELTRCDRPEADHRRPCESNFMPKREAEAAENFLDLVQRLAAEVLGAEHLGFGLLHQVADGLDVGVLEAVVGTDAQLQLFDRAVEHLVHLAHGALGRLFGSSGSSSKLMKMAMWSFSSLAAWPMASCGEMAPLVQTSMVSLS